LHQSWLRAILNAGGCSMSLTSPFVHGEFQLESRREPPLCKEGMRSPQL
jgi:hypothetical protein